MSASIWVPSSGPYDLVQTHGRVRVMVDDGPPHNFLNYGLVKKLKLPQSPSDHKYMVSLANGSDKHVWDTVVISVPLIIQGYAMHLDFQVMQSLE